MSSNTTQVKLESLKDERTVQTIQNVKVKIREYNDELKNLEKTTIEYEETLTTITTLQQNYTKITEELTEQIKTGNTDFEKFNQIFSTATDVLDNTTIGLKSVKDVMESLGIESKELNQAIIAFQTALSITKAISSFSTAIKASNISLKAFNLTLLSNPLIWIAAAVIGVTLAIAGLTGAFKSAKNPVDDLEKSYNNLNKKMEDFNENVEFNVRRLRAQGVEEKDIIKYRQKANEKEIKDRQKLVDKTKEQIKAIDEEIKATEKKWGINADQRAKEIIRLKDQKKQAENLLGKEEEYLEKSLKNRLNLHRDAIVEQDRLETEARRERERQEKEETDKRKAEAEIRKQQELEARKRYNQTLTEMDKERERKRIDALEGQEKVEAIQNVIKENENLLETLKKQSETADSFEERNEALEQYRQLLTETTQLKEEEAELTNTITEEEKRYQATLDAIKNDAEKRRIEALEGEEKLQHINDQIKANQELQAELEETQTKEGVSIEKKTEAAERLREAINEEIKLQKEKEKLEEDEIIRKEELEQLEKDLELAKNPQQLTKQEELDALKEEAKALLDLANDTTKSYAERKKALDDYNKKQKEVAAKSKEIKDEEKKALDEKLKATKDALSATASLIGENTVAGKLMSVAAAIIDTYRAGTATLAATASAGPWVSIPAMTAVIATGLATVKNILATKVPGTNDSSSSADANVSLPSMPELQSPIQETHNNLNAQDEDFFNQSTQVYVVESDITNTQKRVRVAETESAF